MCALSSMALITPTGRQMRMHLEAIDVDLWYVVKNNVPKVGEGVTAADVKRFIQLDSTAKNIICGHLTKGQYVAV